MFSSPSPNVTASSFPPAPTIVCIYIYIHLVSTSHTFYLQVCFYPPLMYACLKSTLPPPHPGSISGHHLDEGVSLRGFPSRALWKYVVIITNRVVHVSMRITFSWDRYELLNYTHMRQCAGYLYLHSNVRSGCFRHPVVMLIALYAPGIWRSKDL